MKAKALFALILLLLLLLLSACTGRDLTDFNLVIALGIDKDETGYMVTYQVLNTKAIASKSGSSESPIIIYSEKGNDLGEIERRVSTQATKKMYFSHVRSVVIGEDLAKDGIKDILDYLFRSNEFRNDFYLVIAKGATSKQILSTVTAGELVSGIKLYDTIENAGKW